MTLLAEIQAVWMFLAGCALLTFILMKRSYRYFGRKRKTSTQPIERQHRPASQWDGAQRDALAVIERQKVEMHEMSRELNGQLTSRIIVLENLISQSQRQIERMEELIEQGEAVR